ncbi:hypothetical protein Tco_1198629, partial [Tanacetum coccineum]
IMNECVGNEGMNVLEVEEGMRVLPSIKVFDDGSMGLNGGVVVIEVWLGLSTHPTSSFGKVDWWEEWVKVHGSRLRECLGKALRS